MSKKLVFDVIKQEQHQLHGTRKHLYIEIEKVLGGMTVVSLFTSFYYPVMLLDSEAEMLEAVLQKSDLSKGLCLIVSSPGGDGLAAERIINICRSYSGTGTYKAIVPSKAKSAATMVCLGAEQIIMGKTSELGAVDPQEVLPARGGKRLYSVYRMLENYKKLFAGAVRTKGRIEPYLQQLSNYDPRDIADYESAMETSTDITVRALKAGMLSSLSEKAIQKKIENLFLKPKTVKTHGRPIYAADAHNCGLNIDIRTATDNLWTKVYELFSRLDNYVSRERTAKCIESKDYHYVSTYSGDDDDET